MTMMFNGESVATNTPSGLGTDRDVATNPGQHLSWINGWGTTKDIISHTLGSWSLPSQRSSNLELPFAIVNDIDG